MRIMPTQTASRVLESPFMLLRTGAFHSFSSLLGAALLAHASLQGGEVLTNAHEIATHFTPKGENALPVLLEATVTFQDPTGTLFLEDNTGATFITGSPNNPKLPRGERLRISGVTHNGLFIGGIKNAHLERLGNNGPVAAHPITPDELASGQFHYRWVTLSGVGRSLRSDGESSATLRVITAGKTIELRFDEAPREGSGLVDAELRVRGLAAGDLNDHRQLVQPYIRVGSMADVEVLKPPPAEPFAIALTPLSELRHSSEAAHRVKVRGVALAPAMAGGLFLRDEDRSVFVQTIAPDVKAGDVVEALGFPEMGVFSAQLSDAECRVVDSQPAPLPRKVSAKELADGADAELIAVDARILQRQDREGRTDLLAQAGPVNLTLHLPGTAPQSLQQEALVQVTGLCRVTATRSDRYRARPSASEIWPRSLEDIAVIRGVPWWTSHRLALALESAALLALAALAWVVLLRRQVARHLAVIEMKAQREAIIEERQRIAREFHDTLEQELAGLSLRLDAATPRVTDEKARSLLEQQQKLLLRLQTETRDFVWDLRDTTRQDAPLDEALRSLLAHLQASTTMALSLQCEGDVPALPVLVKHHLLRITREAVHNAVKYSGAPAVEVTLSSGSEQLRLMIADAGRGFDFASASALEGHFGIRGMNERARKIGADLRVVSRPGEGTRVELLLALPIMKG